MSVCNDVADYQWLTGSDAAGLLAELATSDAPLHTAVQRLRNRLSPAQTHLLVEQVELRRRARAKFSFADRMLFTRAALEQATDEVVARYKAVRFAGQRAGLSSTPAVADLCCGIGGDLVALAEQGAVVGVDCNPIAAHFARWNADAVLATHHAARVSLEVAEAERFELERVAAWHIDPDRRASGRRTTSLDRCRPNLDALERLLARAGNAAVKLAPATYVPSAWAERCELEWISRGGECRQLVAWHGELARSPGRRRATIVCRDRGVAATMVGTPDRNGALTDRVNEYVFDVDPAVLAAGLGGVLAAQYGLCALSGGASYLTGCAPVADPLLSCFQVEDVLPMHLRSLAAQLRERRIGTLEIKKRGLNILPEKLRTRLKLGGENAATLLITPVAGRPTAILAHRVSS